jgi:chemotaxis regulatin CheY-phosphate phosphatase CheZ
MIEQEIPSGVPPRAGENEEHRRSTTSGGDLLKDFVKVVQDVIPILDQMKCSIKESTHKIPRAAAQLSSVTQATETATVEILNVLDSITQKVANVEAVLTRVVDHSDRMRVLGEELERGLDQLALQRPGEHSVVEMRKAWSEFVGLAMNADGFANAKTSLGDVQNATTSIAMALQVQDITAQQIAGVIHLIESVRAQLIQVLANLHRNGDGGETADVPVAPVSPAADDQAFNSDAQYVHSPQRQEMADNIINEWSGPAPQKSE